MHPSGTKFAALEADKITTTIIIIKRLLGLHFFNSSITNGRRTDDGRRGGKVSMGNEFTFARKSVPLIDRYDSTIWMDRRGEDEAKTLLTPAQMINLDAEEIY